jgi:hypothetical protein
MPAMPKVPKAASGVGRSIVANLRWPPCQRNVNLSEEKVARGEIAETFMERVSPIVDATIHRLVRIKPVEDPIADSIRHASRSRDRGAPPMNSTARVRFDSPPVVEVACSVLFSAAKPLRGLHIGLYVERIRRDFPRIEEVPPLVAMIEPRDSGAVGLEIGFAVGPLPPLRRIWLISEDGRNLIQLQEDRFVFNWKKAAADDRYPSYDEVIERFDTQFVRFLAFLADQDIGPLAYRQFELTYVNHIPLGRAEIEVSESR